MRHDPRQIDLLVIHHSAGPLTQTWQDIRRMHLRRFKLGIGYHRIIEPDGFVMDGRRIQVRGAHAPPNANRLGICVIGDNTVPGRGWTESQWASLVAEVTYWCERFPRLKVCGHNQTKPTLCPGLDIGPALLERGFPYEERLVQGRLD